jgi:flagella basal body P-ring formation protein FlgA
VIPKNGRRFSEKMTHQEMSLAMMIRTALIAAAFIAGLASAFAQTPMRMKPVVTVSGDIVRVGDLIENAGLAADTPIFRAPDLGQTGAVSVRTVLDAVRPHGLFAIDVRGISEISVTRASRTIATDDIENLIVRGLVTRYNLGKPENLKVVFEREVRPISLEASITADLSLARMNYEPSSRRFDVTFELASGGRSQWRYTGTAVETVEVAVAQRAFQKGDVFKENDLSFERRPKNEVANEAVAVPADVAGMAARRAIRAGQPIRNSDLAKPELVVKGDTVTLHYEVPGVVITMRGKATDSGAMGDVVGVLNVNTKRTIQGVVTGPSRVTVLAPQSARHASAAPSN